jgi:hypothetical protein
MANQWNAVIATQTVAFRGTSSVGVKAFSTALPQVRALGDAVYGVKVAGGISGTFGVFVVGYVGGTTYVLAGVTNITAAGNYILYPVGYSSTGAPGIPGDVQASVAGIHRLDRVVPPSHVAFQSAVATVGISASCTVSAVMYAHAT